MKVLVILGDLFFKFISIKDDISIEIVIIILVIEFLDFNIVLNFDGMVLFI